MYAAHTHARNYPREYVYWWTERQMDTDRSIHACMHTYKHHLGDSTNRHHFNQYSSAVRIPAIFSRHHRIDGHGISPRALSRICHTIYFACGRPAV